MKKDELLPYTLIAVSLLIMVAYLVSLLPAGLPQSAFVNGKKTIYYTTTAGDGYTYYLDGVYTSVSAWKTLSSPIQYPVIIADGAKVTLSQTSYSEFKHSPAIYRWAFTVNYPVEVVVIGGKTFTSGTAGWRNTYNEAFILIFLIEGIVLFAAVIARFLISHRDNGNAVV